ncbi:hypothetical protein Tco_0803476 [Tanacetum coccineum]|uniref:Uncharacterized protein n=1 Tax=Tanacetum coccineum TaxID=301880 RepID=A0ABQ5A1V0_9ASTR
MFDTGVLDDDEVFVDVTTVEKEEQSTKTGEAVTTAGVKDSVAPTIPTTVEETLAQTLMEIKAAKPKAKGIVFHDQEEQKDYRPRNSKQRREELTDEEKGKLFMELIKKRRKHFVELRPQEKRNIPPTKAQKRTQMSTNLKHMVSRHKKVMKRRKKVVRRKLKAVERRCLEGKEQGKSNNKNLQRNKEWRKTKRQMKLKKLKKMMNLKNHLVIKKDDDIAIDVVPLATKPPVIVNYKLLKEGIMVHYELIRADGSSKRYSSMIRMIQDIDREDLLTLWKLVKTKHGDIRLEDDHERVLWGDFKVMLKRSKVWRDLQVLSPSPLFDPRDFFLPEEILPPQKQARFQVTLPTDSSPHLRKGLGNGRVIIQRDFDQLETKLQEARTHISRFQREQIRHDDEIVLARIRISTLEMIIEDI